MLSHSYSLQMSAGLLVSWLVACGSDDPSVACGAGTKQEGNLCVVANGGSSLMCGEGGGGGGVGGGAGGANGEILVAENPLTNMNDSDMFGACNNRAAAQDFVPSAGGRLTRVRTRLNRYTSPTDDAYLEIHEGGAVPGAGVLIATSDPVAASSVVAASPASVDVDFTFEKSAESNLTEGTKYFFVARKAGSLDCSESAVFRIGSGPDTYPDGKAWTQWQSDEPSAWLEHDFSDSDHVFEVWVK